MIFDEEVAEEGESEENQKRQNLYVREIIILGVREGKEKEKKNVTQHRFIQNTNHRHGVKYTQSFIR